MEHYKFLSKCMENTLKEKEDIGPRHIFVFPIYVIRIIVYPFAWLLLYFFLRMEVSGKENLQSIDDGRVIFAANHNSELDPFAFQYSLSFFSKFVPLYFVSLTKKYYPYEKYGIRSYFYGGLFFRLMGAYPVYKGLNNFECAFQHHINILEKSHTVLIFPEGVKGNGTIGRAKPGVIYLAKRTNSLIVPVKIEGTAKLTIWEILLRKRKLKISFGKQITPDSFPVSTKKFTVDELQNSADLLMDNLCAINIG